MVLWGAQGKKTRKTVCVWVGGCQTKTWQALPADLLSADPVLWWPMSVRCAVCERVYLHVSQAQTRGVTRR